MKKISWISCDGRLYAEDALVKRYMFFFDSI